MFLFVCLLTRYPIQSRDGGKGVLSRYKNNDSQMNGAAAAMKKTKQRERKKKKNSAYEERKITY